MFVFILLIYTYMFIQLALSLSLLSLCHYHFQRGTWLSGEPQACSGRRIRTSKCMLCATKDESINMMQSDAAQISLLKRFPE